jgi:hypothetical protein
MSLTEDIRVGIVSEPNRLADAKPGTWDPEIVYQVARGGMPILAVSNMLPAMTVKSRQARWPEQAWESQHGALTDAFAGPGFTNAIAAAQLIDTEVILQMPEIEARKLVVHYTVQINSETNPATVVGLVTERVINGANSYAKVRIIEPDTDNVLSETDIRFMILGTAVDDFSKLIEPIYHEPKYYNNWLQIQSESLSATGRELNEEERFNEKLYSRMRNQAYQRFLRKREKAFLFGQKKPGNDPELSANNKPRTYSQGIVPALREHYPDNFYDFRTDTDFSGQSWVAGAVDFMDKILLETGRYTTTNSLYAICGNRFRLGIKAIAEARGGWEITTETSKYGFKVDTIQSMEREVKFVTHPEFNENPRYQRSALLLDLDANNLRRMVYEGRDEMFIPNNQSSSTGFEWIDGIKEGFHVDEGLRFNRLYSAAWIDGGGLDNTL